MEAYAALNQKKPRLKRKKIIRQLKKDYQLWLLALPVIIYFIVFHYLPMYGIQIAFKDFIAMKGITGSPWVGFQHFERFITSYQFKRLILNTLGISFYQLAVGFPAPIILALMLNQTKNLKFKKFVQTVTYAPHFISVVVMAGMIILFLSPTSGVINHLIGGLGFDKVNFMANPGYFKTIYVFSGIWQNAGWGAIIYLAALSAISPSLYEAARIDGANKWHLIRYIDIPSIMPTAVILLIMNVGRIMNVGFQKTFLLQNDLNLASSEIISTYIYKVGLLDAQYSYSAAIGLFNTIINILLLVSVNRISKKVTETSLW
ncbi:sugar ABC transporter permease [Vallitalea pronyensis]|uniref:Sugar ABC transporter permease n=1 Tax=Vallitalea pronyensis TaxID=1348613 RepID=A0A8J8MIG9_9FIRM|nr:ABC transporter permease subunit [Vallitalea pronyensis]QUI22239.1 sugar ABC transporter permease [Vallitalea pronyensis]